MKLLNQTSQHDINPCFWREGFARFATAVWVKVYEDQLCKTSRALSSSRNQCQLVWLRSKRMWEVFIQKLTSTNSTHNACPESPNPVRCQQAKLLFNKYGQTFLQTNWWTVEMVCWFGSPCHFCNLVPDYLGKWHFPPLHPRGFSTRPSKSTPKEMFTKIGRLPTKTIKSRMQTLHQSDLPNRTLTCCSVSFLFQKSRLQNHLGFPLKTSVENPLGLVRARKTYQRLNLPGRALSVM